MSPIFVDKTSKTSLKISKVGSSQVEKTISNPVVNEDKKGFFNIFKSFLAVGGDFV
jgi:hypothetical protein